MDERLWRLVTDPDRIRTFLWTVADKRKQRLFQVACCRRVWDSITEDRCRRAVEAAELYADGGITEDEREVAAEAADEAWQEESADSWVQFFRGRGAPGAPFTYRGAAYNCAVETGAWGGAPAFRPPHEIIFNLTDGAEGPAQCDLARCVFGNPFRPTSADPAWLTPTVVALAEGVYRDRAFERLPVLADALEEAGCADADMLDHCRGPGPHARGCWVVDLLTGRG